MKPTINDLILLILDTVLQVNAQGKWIAHFEVSGKFFSAELHFRPADFDYTAPSREWPGVARHDTRLVPDRLYPEAELLANLRAMLAFAQRHLDDQPAELPPAVSIFNVSTGTAEPLRNSTECSETERALREAVRLGQGSHHLPVDDIDTLILELQDHPRGPLATLTADGSATLRLHLPTDPQAAYDRLVTSVQQFIAGYRAARDAA